MSEPTSDPLAAVLDTLIPASEDGAMPGAGAIGLAAIVREKSETMADLVERGLEAADTHARERGAPSFAGLSLADRTAVLRELETSEPGFVPGLVFQTFAAYYQHPRVLEALGLEPRPPHPKGYELEAGDLGGLERVRARGRLYREA
jgi:hypothetical protein